eukprot:763585-Hanusia_phi.AAC.2
MEFVVFLYLLDNDTSYLVLFTVGGGLVVNLWKVSALFNLFPFALLTRDFSFSRPGLSCEGGEVTRNQKSCGQSRCDEGRWTPCSDSLLRRSPATSTTSPPPTSSTSSARLSSATPFTVLCTRIREGVGKGATPSESGLTPCRLHDDDAAALPQLQVQER